MNWVQRRGGAGEGRAAAQARLAPGRTAPLSSTAPIRPLTAACRPLTAARPRCPARLQVTVTFEAGANQDAAYKAVKKNGKAARRRARLAQRRGGGEVVTAEIPAGLSVDEAVRTFQAQRGVARAEPDFKVRRQYKRKGVGISGAGGAPVGALLRWAACGTAPAPTHVPHHSLCPRPPLHLPRTCRFIR